jgi:hypothetical protein
MITHHWTRHYLRNHFELQTGPVEEINGIAAPCPLGKCKRSKEEKSCFTHFQMRVDFEANEYLPQFDNRDPDESS